jgi:hypothetical protein
MARRNNAWLDYFPETVSSDPLKLLFDYLQYCMGFSPELVEKVTTLSEHFRADMDALLQGYPAPDLVGWFVLRRA